MMTDDDDEVTRSRGGTPIRSVSMKTDEKRKTPPPRKSLPKMRLRTMAEVSGEHSRPLQVHGRLAPPRDPREVAKRRARDLVIWTCVAFIVACAVTLGVWFLARR